MTERYLPASEFLNFVLADEIVFDDSVPGKMNLERLLEMVDHEDRSNRDWAAFLIAGLPFDSDDVRAALRTAADDDDADVRDEAIVGLARRDRNEALRRLHPLLEDDWSSVLFEAATILGDSSLLPALREVRLGDNARDTIRQTLQEAISACEAGVGQDHSGWPETPQHIL